MSQSQNVLIQLFLGFLQHIEKMFKHKELEAQLGEAKLEQANLQLSETKERSSQERDLVSPSP